MKSEKIIEKIDKPEQYSPIYRDGKYINLPKSTIFLAPENSNIYSGNIYVQGYGYLTQHIPPEYQRGRIEHWDSQYKDPSTFETSWKPRTGPLNFLKNIYQGLSRKVKIVNLGAGLGDFSIDLAKTSKMFTVYHVDFSETGNSIARKKLAENNPDGEVKILTEDNNIFLENFLKDSNKADVIFLYGASGSNEPSDIEYEKTLKLCASGLQAGGFLWSVSMIQPKLLDHSDNRVTDTFGDFPKTPGLATTILTNSGLVLMRESVDIRSDFHPLIPGGPPVQHNHLACRALYAKPLSDGKIPAIPSEFSFI